MMMQWQANLILAGLALLTGSTYLAAKHILPSVDAFSFIAIRFGLSALCLYSLLYKRIHRIQRNTLFACLRVGVFLGLGQICAQLGLRTSASGQAAFIISMEVALVPLIGLILFSE